MPEDRMQTLGEECDGRSCILPPTMNLKVRVMYTIIPKNKVLLSNSIDFYYSSTLIIGQLALNCVRIYIDFHYWSTLIIVFTVCILGLA